MNLDNFFKDKLTKPSDKPKMLTGMLADKAITIDDLLTFTMGKKEAITGSCIEAIEHITKTEPQIVTSPQLSIVIHLLSHDGPRVKMEAGRVIANIIRFHPNQVKEAIMQLLPNTIYNGTVVRWSAAFALSEILLMKTSQNDMLIPAIKEILTKEDKNSIKNIYLKALKKIG